MQISPLDRKPWRPGFFVTHSGLLLTPRHLKHVGDAEQQNVTRVTTEAIERMMRA